MKFLIVDDSPAMQAIVRRALEKVGYQDLEFQTAGDGVEALDIIRNWEPDLVISDWHMPNMTGIELLEEIKKQMLDIKVGLVTTETSPVKIVQAKEAGALFVVHKPFEIKELQKAVLPIVQGSVEGEQMLSESAANPEEGNIDSNLQMPSIPAIEKILDGFASMTVKVTKTERTGINYKYLPYVLGLFADNEKDRIKAVCIMDLRATAILGCAYNGARPEIVKATIESKTLSKGLLDNNKKLLKMISALFFDPSTQQDLTLKSVNLIPKPFDRLDQLGSSSSEKRIDFKVSVEGFGEGQAILMAVAD